MLVVKIGGTSGVNFAAVVQDVAAHVAAGHKLAVVHGGPGETNAISEQLGHPPRFVTSPSGFWAPAIFMMPTTCFSSPLW